MLHYMPTHNGSISEPHATNTHSSDSRRVLESLKQPLPKIIEHYSVSPREKPKQSEQWLHVYTLQTY